MKIDEIPEFNSNDKKLMYRIIIPTISAISLIIVAVVAGGVAMKVIGS